MSDDGASFTFVLNESNTSIVERLALIVACSDGVGSAQWSGGIDVTLSGLAWAEDENLTPIAALILIPFIIALVMLVGAVTLDPVEHVALKIGLFLASFVPFYIGTWWAAETVGRFYNFPTLTNAIADTNFYYTVFFILLVFYIIAYFIWKAFELMAQKKKERLTY